jgi:hypothetical protein
MQSLLSEGTQAAVNLPLSPAGFGLLAIATFGLLLAVTFAFRSISNRH